MTCLLLPDLKFLDFVGAQGTIKHSYFIKPTFPVGILVAATTEEY